MTFDDDIRDYGRFLERENLGPWGKPYSEESMVVDGLEIFPSNDPPIGMPVELVIGHWEVEQMKKKRRTK